VEKYNTREIMEELMKGKYSPKCGLSRQLRRDVAWREAKAIAKALKTSREEKGLGIKYSGSAKGTLMTAEEYARTKEQRDKERKNEV